MIRLEATLDGAGVLVEYRASGHAGAGPAGADIVCAAVSALSRSLVRALHGKDGVTVRSDAPERGRFSVEICYTNGAREFLEGAGAFLLEGLASVAEEYPEHCKLTVTRKQEAAYGT
ncbi:MAG: ribosomal-processing cysteine protease Prp [Spirochaetaceae bacterium]|nr:ribosomal-processing cysteine protease Prp [Spirochaetaceae bacterium]